MGAKRPSDRPSIMPIPPNVPVSRPLGDIRVGGGPGIPPRFPRGRRRRGQKDEVNIMPVPPRDGPRILPIPPDFVCPDPEMGILMADGSQKKSW